MIIVASLAIIVIAEGGRRWAEMRLTGQTDTGPDPTTTDGGMLAADA
jgi:hypothetical protein